MGLNQGAMGEKLGLSLNYISNLESGKKVPSDSVRNHVDLLEEAMNAGLLAEGVDSHRMKEDLPPYLLQKKGDTRLIPLLGWAHAGDPVNYEENHDAPKIPTECRDPKAFAVKLKGDSMEPTFHENDVLVLMPSEEAYSGVFAVVKFADDEGYVFRRVEFENDIVRLIPVNVRYQVTEYPRKKFAWIYPAWGRWTQLW